MIIDTFSLLVGRIIIGTVLLLGLSIAWYYIIRNFSQHYLEVKALSYAIGSNLKHVKKQGLSSKIDMRVGREWFITYKNKTYLWRCVEVKER